MSWKRSIASFGILLGGCASDSQSGAHADFDESGIVSDSADASESADDNGAADASASGTAPSGTVADDSGEGPKFDLDGQPDVSVGCDGGGKGGGPGFSYIWIANSTQGTVSKINTETLIEEGRYIVRSDSDGNPSRTSVNLNGDMAVANRASGVTKIIARTEQCNDPTNTSTGGADIKPWMDGCIAWFTPFDYASQRPVAWTQGEYSDDTCRYENTKLWTSGANDTIDVILIDGETGVVEQTVPVPGVSPNFYGIYGAAVDNEGNFWGSQNGIGSLVRVDIDDFAVSVWPMNQNGYGMTVDHEGRPWICFSGVSRFDPMSQTWTMSNTITGSLLGGGCMVDADGILWFSGFDSLRGFDSETLVQVQSIPIPAHGKGISIDFQGNVWAVSSSTGEAYRVNPTTQQVDTVGGLVDPYTYSDMTGFALSAAGGPAG